MADYNKAQVKGGTLYAPSDPVRNDTAFEWMRGGSPPYANMQEFLRPIPRPGEKMNLDDEGAQSLQDAMRLRMQLPR